MVLDYLDIVKRDSKRKRIHARITTDHPASSYGLPVVILEDGNCLDYQSWVFLGYRVFSIGKRERPLMQKWLENLYTMLGQSSGGEK